MAITIGSEVRLKSYEYFDDYKRHVGEKAVVYAISASIVRPYQLRWCKDGETSSAKLENLIDVSTLTGTLASDYSPGYGYMYDPMRWQYQYQATQYGNWNPFLTINDGTTTKKPMSLRERFVLAITPEPKKSFRKAGITNGDDLLTESGRDIFLAYLLHNKFATDFKKEVVDDILKEKEQEDNN